MFYLILFSVLTAFTSQISFADGDSLDPVSGEWVNPVRKSNFRNEQNDLQLSAGAYLANKDKQALHGGFVTDLNFHYKGTMGSEEAALNDRVSHRHMLEGYFRIQTKDGENAERADISVLASLAGVNVRLIETNTNQAKIIFTFMGFGLGYQKDALAGYETGLIPLEPARIEYYHQLFASNQVQIDFCLKAKPLQVIPLDGHISVPGGKDQNMDIGFRSSISPCMKLKFHDRVEVKNEFEFSYTDFKTENAAALKYWKNQFELTKSFDVKPTVRLFPWFTAGAGLFYRFESVDFASGPIDQRRDAGYFQHTIGGTVSTW